MLSHIEIRNFQSLHHVDLDLHPLTVIVGASSSGKSAFTRALRTLTSNRRGADFITHGEKITTISAVTDNGTVTLKRGKGTNDNEYAVTPTHEAHPLYPQRSFTKLNGETPPEVSEFIGIPAKDPINYAGQFDKPYLLDDSASEVARVFGALTNVHVIFEAARESNRRKLSTSATLKTRAADLASIKERAIQYRPLRQQLAAIEQAEILLDRARAIQLRIEKISSALSSLTEAVTVIRRMKPVLETTIPDITTITDRAQRLSEIKSTFFELTTAARAAHTAAVDLKQHADDAERLDTLYMQTLIASATCPTCGQSTQHLTSDHREASHA